jgi:hypothetical protein
MSPHALLEQLWRSPTIRAMDHAGELQAVLRAARASSECFVPVVLESPFAGAPPEYVHRCIRDCILRGEAPIASHVLYTQALNDADPTQREAGILAGFCWRWLATRTVVYTDLGISRGMARGIEHAKSLGTGHAIEYREIGK